MREYCYIELTQGQVARVSPEKFAELSKDDWYATQFQGRPDYYAARMSKDEDGNRFVILMHRQIMGFPDCHVDHRLGNTLDNRCEMLRLATHAENIRNSKLSKANTSGFKGVSLRSDTNVWTARIRINKVYRSLGTFTNKYLAYAAYCAAAREHHGEFARLA